MRTVRTHTSTSYCYIFCDFVGFLVCLVPDDLVEDFVGLAVGFPVGFLFETGFCFFCTLLELPKVTTTFKHINDAFNIFSEKWLNNTPQQLLHCGWWRCIMGRV